MDKDNLANVFKRYIDNQYSQEDLKIILTHFKKEGDRELIISWINDEMDQDVFSKKVEEETDEIIEVLDKKIYKYFENLRPPEKDYKVVPIYNRIGFKIAAAILVFCTLAGILYYQSNQSKLIDNSQQFVEDREPGGNKATLQLADGKTINLNDEKEGIIINKDRLTYNDGTEVSQETLKNDNATLVLNTPNSGQYQITLPDGTKVWLNSATTLKYPTRFSGAERRVELSGEAYFEVVKNTSQPFYVISEGQEIKVLGTHFNVKAYSEEQEIRTSLLEGSISVAKSSEHSESKVLKVGQQSIVLANTPTIEVKNIDVENSIAWKDGYFSFQKMPIESVLAEIARWYDVKVDNINLPPTTITANINKNTTLSNLLYGLEKVSGLKFTLKEGRLMREE